MAEHLHELAIAVRIEECRTTLQRLFGDRYPTMVAQWRELIRDVAVSHGECPLVALLRMMELGNKPAVDMWLCAATADEIEANVPAEVRRG